jgi:hypothetical protein
MQVEDALSSVRSLVDHHAVALWKQSGILGDLSPGKEQLTERTLVALRRVMDSGQVLPRNDEYVGRRLGIYVLERENVVVLEDDLRGDFLFDDLAEKAHGRAS